MTKRTLIRHIDDLDGTAVVDGEVRTVSFSPDGVAYEIGLSDAHIRAFPNVLAPFVGTGRRTGRRAVSLVAMSDPIELRRIREWAKG